MAFQFLDIEEFTTQYGKTLSVGETAIAERLLTVVTNRILDLKPDADEDAAAQVVFEVVRDALTYGGLEKLSSFQNITANRQEAGTFDAELKVVNDYLSARHKRILGIAVSVGARGHFMKCDY